MNAPFPLTAVAAACRVTRLWLDLETFSETPIKDGTHRYAENAEILLFAYALDDGEVEVWDVTDGGPMPDDLRHALLNAPEVWAHNSGFDRTVLRNVMPTLCPPIERWRDTMVQALAHSLPGALGTLSEVLGLDADDAKDKRGKQLVRLFCMPRKFVHHHLPCDFETKAAFKAAVAKAKADWCGRATKETHPREWAEFVSYAANDIKAMRVIERKLPKWNYAGTELAMWHLDQRINDRGVMTDTALATAAVRAVEREQKILAERTVDLTLGQVSSANKRQALIDHLLEFHGFAVDDLKGSTLEKKLEQADLDPIVRELLMVRLQASTTSTSKYKALLKAVSRDGRLRGLLQFCGAGRTGRWAGRVFQPQNLPRPTLKQRAIDAGIQDLIDGVADLVHDDVMALTSSCIRGCLVAAPGKKMPIADLSNIEGRGLAWLAQETWKLDAFSEFDDQKLQSGGWIGGFEWARRTRAGETIELALDKKGETIHRGHDLYAVAYAKSFSVTPEVVMENKKTGDGSMRQIGKIQELALGFGGGVGAFVTFATGYGIDLDELAGPVLSAADQSLVNEARGMYTWLMDKKKGKNTYGLPPDTWVACDVIKRGWRQAHQATSSWWGQLEQAFRDAIDNPGVAFEARTVTCHRPMLKSGKPGQWTTIVLPSGRRLCYPGARIEQETGEISYMGVNQFNRKWSRIKTYGGKLSENCIAQGTPVLTDRGPVPVERVTTDMRVWDGVEFVQHQGLVAKGEQEVMECFGVWMTPDHKVLTTEGWKHAASTSGCSRAPCGLSDRDRVLYEGRPATPPGPDRGLRLRGGSSHEAGRLHEVDPKREHLVVRVQAQGDHQGETDHARDDLAPGVCGVALDAGAVLRADAPGLGQLRGSGHRGLRTLARVLRELLGGYVARVLAGSDAGSEGQQRGLRPQQLPVGDLQGAGEQQARECAHRRPDGGAILRVDGHRADDAVVSVEGRRADPSPGRGAERRAQVYDLVNCGPRSRFVCLDRAGRALIVHNCTQAFARDVLAFNMPLIEAQGYEIVLSVHDELLTETPDTDEYSSDRLAAWMANVPPWATGLPLAAAGFETYRYRKD